MQFARLKPHNGKAHVLRSFTIFGIRFLETRGWYQVEDDVAEELKKKHQIQEDPLSAKAFDVVDTLEEAEEIDELERRKAERAKAKEAYPTKRVHVPTATEAREGTLTTADLPGRSVPKKTSFDDQDGTFNDQDMAGKPRAPRAMVDGADEDEPEETVARAQPVIRSTPPKPQKAIGGAAARPGRAQQAPAGK